MAALPQELIEEILSRLSVKSLLRFKTAYKKWYSLISKDVKLHSRQLTSSSSASKNLIFYQTPEDNPAIFRCSDVDTNAFRKISFPVEIGKPCLLIGSANGLICIKASWYKIDCCYIMNPCTGQFTRLCSPIPNRGIFGFGYDSISDDYKIIGIWSSQFRIFSLKRNSWKTIECPDVVSYPTKTFSILYLNGAIHWFSGGKIIAFDLAKDQIFFLDLPDKFNLVDGFCPWVYLFIDYQGSLCVSGCNSIWVMKEYGNTKSWAHKLTTISLPDEYARPVGISRLGELGFRTDCGFVKSDILGKISYYDKSGMRWPFENAFAYKESLISPRCFKSK